MTRDDLIYGVSKALKDAGLDHATAWCRTCDKEVTVAVEKPLAERLIDELDRYGLQIVKAP